MPFTINDEILGVNTWRNKDLDLVEEVPNLFYNFAVEFCPIIVIAGEEELSDEEILSLPEKIGMFSFLDDSEEDIYTEDDGTPLL